MARPLLGGVTPILRVSNVHASVDYYTRVLGFTIDFFEIIASVSRDRCSIFLVQGDQGHIGGWVWIGVNDVVALHEEYRQRGAIIRQPPTNFPWACEMQVADPDGNVLRIGSDSKPHRPFGRWLDMDGRLWEMNADGVWSVAKSDVVWPEMSQWGDWCGIFPCGGGDAIVTDPA